MLQQVTKQVLLNSARTACYGGRHTITLIPGEGIGPEMFGQVRRTVDIMGLPINFEEVNVKGTDDLTEAMNSIQRNGVCLKGNIVTQWPIHKSRNLLLRHDLDLYANVVHAKSFDSIDTRHKNIDIVVIRENTEGEYSAMSHQAVPGVVESLKVCTRTNTERIAEYAFQYATKWGRKRVTCVHKANIMKKGDGLFRKVCAEVAQRYPNIEYNDIIVDNCTMQLVSKPHQFDVMVMPNLYGNIISNMLCGLVGGPGLVSGGNFNEELAVFEQATRNSGRKIAGQNLANPTAYLTSTSKMMRHLGMHDEAIRLRSAVEAVVNEDKIHTVDIGGTHKTSDFMNALEARLLA